jgi:hypothetical protein
MWWQLKLKICTPVFTRVILLNNRLFLTMVEWMWIRNVFMKYWNSEQICEEDYWEFCNAFLYDEIFILQVSLLSCPWVWQLYRIQIMHPQGHFLTVAVLTDIIKRTSCRHTYTHAHTHTAHILCLLTSYSLSAWVYTYVRACVCVCTSGYDIRSRIWGHGKEIKLDWCKMSDSFMMTLKRRLFEPIVRTVKYAITFWHTYYVRKNI